MFFLNWWRFGAVVVALLIAGFSIYGFAGAAKISGRWLRIGVRSLCLLLGAIGSLAGVLLLAASGCVSYSAPIYSPSGKLAVRVESDDEGATGGNTTVQLYWAHGFRTSTIFWGDWQAVRPTQVRWINDSELRISYTSQFYTCDNAAGVKVECVYEAQ
jgi:hypothetical protein